MEQKENKIILFYGPPASGKGTQINFLSNLLKTPPIDAGYSLRTFVKQNPQNPIAISIENRISQGLPALTEDYFYILKDQLVNKINNNENIIFDKPGGSLPEEAQWFSEFIEEQKKPVTLFHMHISLEETISRISNRWFIEGSNQSYTSKEEAEKNTNDTSKIYKRNDDADIEKIKNRYTKLYQSNTKIVLDILSKNKYFNIVSVPENLDIESTQKFIIDHI